jgi:1,4-alpha-glucan branching enzyme
MIKIQKLIDLCLARFCFQAVSAAPLFLAALIAGGCGASGPSESSLPQPAASSTAAASPTATGSSTNSLDPSATMLGAIPHADSTWFGVWAPYAQAVQVIVDGHAPVDLVQAGASADASAATWTGTVPDARAGDRYVYHIEHDDKWADYDDPRGQELTSSDASAKSVIVSDTNPPRPMKERPFKDWVIYELHIGTFNGAGAPGTYTFAGAMEKLDYLKQLGIDAVEVMPVNPNAVSGGHTPADFDWGYNPVQFDAVNEQYGGPSGLKQFVNACHQRGIAVILDVVYNHTAGANLLKDFDGYSAPDSPNGAYFYGGALGGTAFGPRPDFDTAQVKSYIEDSALMWLRDFGIDGLRWDSVDNIRRYQANPLERKDIPGGAVMLREINDVIAQQQPGKLSLAEDLQGWAAITNPTSTAQGFGFNSQWDDGMFWALHTAVATPVDGDRDMNSIAKSIGLRFGDDAFHRVIFTEDHDTVGHPSDSQQVRLPSLIDSANPESIWAKKRSTLAAGIVLTSPGIPMLFQGQELLTPGAFNFGAAQGVDWSRTQSEAGILRMYHDMIAVRLNIGRRTAGLEGENITLYPPDNQNKILSYYRYDKGGPGDDVIIVANFANKRATVNTAFPRAGIWLVRFNSGSSSYDPTFQDGGTPDVTATAAPLNGEPCSGDVIVGPYSLVVLSQ